MENVVELQERLFSDKLTRYPLLERPKFKDREDVVTVKLGFNRPVKKSFWSKIRLRFHQFIFWVRLLLGKIKEHPEIIRRRKIKESCRHLWPDHRTYNIHWMKHVDGIVRGVCGICNSQFDTSKEEDKKYIQINSLKWLNMGEARA